MSTLPATPCVTDEDIVRFLVAARDTIADVPFAWLATRSLDGGTNARAVRVHPGKPEQDEWTRRFLVRRGSRKVVEMTASPRVTLAFQHASGDAYIALGGFSHLLEDRAEMRVLWSPDADRLFPAGFAEQHMIAVRLDVDRIEVHLRGVTREPFGHGRTLLDRTDGRWRFIPDY